MRDDVKLSITIIGKDIFELVKSIFYPKMVKTVKTVNSGKLGNLTTLTYILTVSEEEAFSIRKNILAEMSGNSDLIPLMLHGDWSKIFVLKRFAPKTRL